MPDNPTPICLRLSACRFCRLARLSGCAFLQLTLKSIVQCDALDKLRIISLVIGNRLGKLGLPRITAKRDIKTLFGVGGAAGGLSEIGRASGRERGCQYV